MKTNTQARITGGTYLSSAQTSLIFQVMDTGARCPISRMPVFPHPVRTGCGKTGISVAIGEEVSNTHGIIMNLRRSLVCFLHQQYFLELSI